LVEYVALILGAVALMFALIEIGFNIKTPEMIDTGNFDIMDFIKVFFILAGFGMGFFVIGLSMAIAAEDAASAGLQSLLSLGLTIWGILFFVLIGAFVVYYVWWVPKKLAAMLKEKKKRYDEDIT